MITKEVKYKGKIRTSGFISTWQKMVKTFPTNITMTLLISLVSAKTGYVGYNLKIIVLRNEFE